MNSRNFAIFIAGKAHQDQMYGESPYLLHLSAVDDVLAIAGYEECHPVRIAAWLHDSIEDSDGKVTKESIKKSFGEYIALLVWSVTNEPGANRKEKALKTYPKIMAVKDAIALKLADRIANLEHSLKTYSRFGLMYVKEDYVFRSFLYDEPITDGRLLDLWSRYTSVIDATKTRFGI